jgi:catechol 2,3-dioxygenase-like lactoylglutathione lyase family enzyme
MALGRLDHYSIRTTRLAATETFYTEVLGLSVGARPAFKFPGLWLYNGDRAVVHVVGIDRDNPQPLIDYLGEKALEDADETGSIDHIAFTAEDFSGMKARFAAAGCSFRERMVPSMNLAQIFLEDPNGVTIELNFPG